ncbi:hypothetical protein BBP40_007851 [Aspergillus hancockii]|nr:hypothetical protein BBP40_007851 [Aspergillus hancockii]
MPASQSQPAAPAGPKLRDSCHGCAASKLKCSKEKPTCARCTKRGIVCEYFATRRAGRKQGSRPSNAPPVTQTLPPTPTATSWSTVSGPEALASPSLARLSPRMPLPSYPDLLPDFLSSSDQTSASAPTSTSSVQFDDFLASPLSFPILDPSDADSLTDPSGINTGSLNAFLDIGSSELLLLPDHAFSVPEEAVRKPLPFSKPQSPPDSRPSTTNGFHPESSSCSCLARALSILKQLCPATSGPCRAPKGCGYDTGLAPRPNLQAVITNNEQTIETISNMLHCQCAQDGYLLTIMALIVFKVLGWYAIAARETSSSEPSHGREFPDISQQPQRFPSEYSVDGEDHSRMAGQVVLSELHRVQRLVKVLSQRLKIHGMPNQGSSDPLDQLITHGTEISFDAECTFPLPITMLHQLETDLRKRLRGLSAEIVEMLRRR